VSGGGGIDLLTPIVEGSSPFTRNQLLSAPESTQLWSLPPPSRDV